MTRVERSGKPWLVLARVRSGAAARSAFWGSVVVFGASILVTVLTALAGVYLARTLAVVEYGRLAYFLSIYVLVSLLAGLGLTTRVIASLARFAALGQADALNRAFYSQLVLRLLTAVGLVPGGLVVAQSLHEPLYLYAGITAALAVLDDFLLGVFQALHQLRRFVVGLVAQPLVYVLILASGLTRTAAQVVAAIALSFAVAIVANAVLLRGTAIRPPVRADLSGRATFQSLGFLTQVYLMVLLQNAFGQYAQLALGSAARFVDAAHFAVALAPTRLLPLALAAIAQAIFYPRLSAALARGDRAAATALCHSFAASFLGLGFCAMAVMAWFPRTVIELLYRDTYPDVAPLVALLAPLNVLLALESVLALTLLVRQQARELIVVLALRLVAFAVVVGVALALGWPAIVAVVGGAYVVLSLASVVALAWPLRGPGHAAFALRGILPVLVGACGIVLVVGSIFPETAGPDRFLLARLVALGVAFGALVGFAFVVYSPTFVPVSHRRSRHT